MQKRLFIRIVATAVFFITTSAAWGAPVTPEQAFARLAGANGPAGAKGCGPRMRLTHTFKTSDAPSAYVFAGTDGYLLAPADDLAPAVLGYMERFDPDNIPAAMQWWIDQYARTTVWPEPDADDGDHPAIPAMLTTKWGQWAPYNMLCPEDAGVRSVTGCVATALAQILNYHKWPQGTGTYSSSRNGYELKFDYGATTFDWSRLRDSYGEDATDAEREDVFQSGVGTGRFHNVIHGCLSHQRTAQIGMEHCPCGVNHPSKTGRRSFLNAADDAFQEQFPVSQPGRAFIFR